MPSLAATRGTPARRRPQGATRSRRRERTLACATSAEPGCLSAVVAGCGRWNPPQVACPTGRGGSCGGSWSMEPATSGVSSGKRWQLWRVVVDGTRRNPPQVACLRGRGGSCGGSWSMEPAGTRHKWGVFGEEVAVVAGSGARSLACRHGRHCGRQMPTNPRRSSVQHRRPAGHGWPARSVAQRVPSPPTTLGAADAPGAAAAVGAAAADASGAADAPCGADAVGDPDAASEIAPLASPPGVVGEAALGWLGDGFAGPQAASAHRNEVGTRTRRRTEVSLP